MTTQYEVGFADLSQQISPHSPNAIPVLDQMKQECGTQLAYYAAFVLVCLRARRDQQSHQPVDELMRPDLQDFTFFTAAKDHPTALRLFDKLLAAYQRDQADETQPHQPFPDTNPSASRLDASASAGSAS